MRINVISIGKLSKEFTAIANHYLKMFTLSVKCHEISYSKKLAPEQLKFHEAELIKKYISTNAEIIILDVKGEEISSLQFAELIGKQMMKGKNIDFIIGGAYGFDPSIYSLAHSKISLSSMTFPHQLAKIMLLEQLYRADTIIRGHPYHK